MVYNEKEDKLIKEVEKEISSGNIFVGRIMQYKNTEKKLQITRKISGKNGWQFAKLGRITKQELPFFKEVIAILEGEL